MGELVRGIVLAGASGGGAMRSRLLEITVTGPVRADALASLADVGVHASADHTVLTADVRDPAALHGLLQRLHGLGLELVELRSAAPSPDVEIVVHGTVGPLLGAMLHGATVGDAVDTTTYRIREVDLVSVLATLEQTRSPGPGVVVRAAGDERVEPRPQDRDRPGGVAERGEDGMETALDEMGPVDYLVVEFPENRLNGEAFPLLLDLVDRGIIRLIDLAFVAKDEDGTVTGVELQDLEIDGDFDVSVFQGASSALLGEDDIQEVGVALDPGSAAGVLVYENTWAAPFASALRRGGGQLVASGRIPVQALLAALDAADAA